MSGAMPLDGVRVLDIATFLAAPFCGTILADFGAEVIKIEQPGTGDPLRRFGTPSPCGDTYVWLSEARNKRFATLDLRQPEGAGLFLKLVAQADVVLENFRPGTMEKWDLGYERLSAANPRLIMLRVSAYGQTGPYSKRPGFARIAHAFSGLAHLSGEAGRRPVVPGSTSLADYLSGMWGAIGVLLALREAEKTGLGQEIDVALYESVFRLLDEIAPVYAAQGTVRERMGADVAAVVPHSHYQAADGIWLALACSNERMFERLCRAMGRAELACDERFSTMQSRLQRRDEVNAIVASWVAQLPSDQIQGICDAHEVPCSRLMNIADICADPQFEARGDLEQLVDPRVGELVLPAAVPRLSRSRSKIQHAGGPLGADNRSVFQELLGLSAKHIDELIERKVI